MILDPEVNGCNIWHKQMVTKLHGNLDEVCRELYRRITAVVDIDYNSNPIVEQLCDIGIDIGGIGITYKHILNAMGLHTYDIKGRNKDVVIPIRNEGMVGINRDHRKDKY